MDLRKQDLRDKSKNVIKGHVTPFTNKETKLSSKESNQNINFNNLKDCFTSIDSKR